MEESPLAAVYGKRTELRTVAGSMVPWVFEDVGLEHEALRTSTGVLDYSSAGQISVTGRGAQDFLQSCVTRDVTYLFPGRAFSGLVLDERGTVVDLVVVHRLDEGYLVETSFGRLATTLAHLARRCPADVEVCDVTGEHVLIGIEGPGAWDLLNAHITSDDTAGMPFQSWAAAFWQQRDVWVTRTGFTGEYGFKIQAPTEHGSRMWEALCADARAVGYNALEIAMLEVRQPILERELWNGGGVLNSGWNWLVDLGNENFCGRDALLDAWRAGPTALSIGFAPIEGLADVGPGDRVLLEKQVIGEVVFGVGVPMSGTTLGLARLEPDLAASGLEFTVSRSSQRELPIRTLSAPYVIPRSWSGKVL